MDFSDESEIYDEEVNEIRPYMYEPRAVSQEEQSVSDSDSEFEDSSDDSFNGNVDEWCECGCCIHMPTAHERKCCQSTNIVDGKAESEGVPCITLHEGFQVNCLNIHVLETSYYEFIHNNGPREENQEIHELYRYLAYRRFTRLVYGLLPSVGVSFLHVQSTPLENSFPQRSTVASVTPSSCLWIQMFCILS